MAILKSLFSSLKKFVVKKSRKSLRRIKKNIAEKFEPKEVVLKIKRKPFRKFRLKKSARRPKALRKKSKKTAPKKPQKKLLSAARPRVKSAVKKAKAPSAQKIRTARLKEALKAIPRNFLIGEITHYFSKIEVCVIKITQGRINIGDRLRIKGRAGDFMQQVRSLQIENNNVSTAVKGQLVGLKIDKKAKPGDKVYKSERP